MAYVDIQSPRTHALASLQPGVPRDQQITALIDEAGFKLSDLSLVARVSDQTIRNWRSEEESSERLPDELDDVRSIAENMIQREQLAADQVGDWFAQRNRLLNHRRPIDVIMLSGGFETVLSAADRDFDSLS